MNCSFLPNSKRNSEKLVFGIWDLFFPFCQQRFHCCIVEITPNLVHAASFASRAEITRRSAAREERLAEGLKALTAGGKDAQSALAALKETL
ncbi:hypothetical protein IID10_10885, partial [candidate division KSB1 bacterium]|nr:hypothetical protein [candidate division KSB1 bacterium]